MIGIRPDFFIPMNRSQRKQGVVLQNEAKSMPWSGTGQAAEKMEVRKP
jgi:hypothetical protein